MLKNRINKFRPIGKSVLHRIIGIRANYVEKNLQLPSCCQDCPAAKTILQYDKFKSSKEYKNAISVCKNCDHYEMLKISQTKASPLYVNEMNKYGSGDPLKYTAILLFITYHMLCDESYGMSLNVSVKELADLLGCSCRAIRYNQQLLEEHNYITTSEGDYPGAYHILINNYSSYFLKAKEGGRGFYTLSSELFHSLLELKGTNQLRIILKCLLDSDDSHNKNEYIHSYKDIQLFLPGYCKRNVIKSSLSKLSSKIASIDIFTHTIRFSLNTKFDGKSTKADIYKANYEKLSSIISDINKELKESATVGRLPSLQSLLKEQPPEPVKSYAPFHINREMLDNITSLSVEYTVDHTIRALSYIYYHYICGNHKIKNFGGLMRERIRQIIKDEYITSSNVQFT